MTTPTMAFPWHLVVEAVVRDPEPLITFHNRARQLHTLSELDRTFNDHVSFFGWLRLVEIARREDVNNSVGLLLDTFDPTVRTAPTLRSRSRPRVTEETVRNVLKSKNTSALTLLDSPHYVKLVRKAPVLAALRLHIYNLSSWTNLTKAFRHFGLSPKHDSHLLKPAIVPFCGDEWFLDFDTSDIVDWQVAMDAAFVKFGSDEKRLEHLRHMDALRRRQKTMTHVRSQRRMGLVQDISSRVGPILRDVLSRYVSDVDIRSSPQRLSMLSRALLPAERSSVAMRVYMSGKKTPYSASVLASASASISADSSSDRTSALKASCAVLSSLASACSSDLTRASCDDDLEASLSAATMIATSVSASASAITNTIFFDCIRFGICCFGVSVGISGLDVPVPAHGGPHQESGSRNERDAPPSSFAFPSQRGLQIHRPNN